VDGAATMKRARKARKAVKLRDDHEITSKSHQISMFRGYSSES
jgi:hypothetical protein